MNDGDSAGGLGLNPASPAVTDRRSTQQINTTLSNTSTINSQSGTESNNTQYKEIFSQQLQQTTISGSAVLTSQPLTQISPNIRRNILVVTTIQQPMTIITQPKESISSPIVSVVNRPSSYNSTDLAVPITSSVSSLTPTHSQVKRFKLDIGVPDITALKKKILEHKLARKRIIKEK